MSILFGKSQKLTIQLLQILSRMPRGRPHGGLAGHPALDDNRPKGVMTAYAFFVQVLNRYHHILLSRESHFRSCCRLVERSTNASSPTRWSCSPISRRSAPTDGRPCLKRRRGDSPWYVFRLNFTFLKSIIVVSFSRSHIQSNFNL